MSEYYGAHIHYRCAFQLESEDSERRRWGDLIRGVRSWLCEKVPEEGALGGRWFYRGGEWKSSATARTRVRVDSAVGSGAVGQPEYWALSYEHPCSDVPLRQWRTDIGVTCLRPDAFEFVLTTTYRLLPGTIGLEPVPPIPTAPRIVGSLLRSRAWAASAGSEPLHCSPRCVGIGEAYKVASRLRDPDRACPIVYLSFDPVDDRPGVNPGLLARLLCGVAIVNVSSSPAVDDELEHFIGSPDLRCKNGMIRVYQPGLRPEREHESKRHRFFTRPQIDHETPEVVTDIIVRSIAGRGRLCIRGARSVEDVRSKQRELRLAELRSLAPAGPQQEWVSLLEEVNQSQVEKIRELEGQVLQQEDGLQAAEAQMDALRDDIAGLKHVKAELESRCKTFEAEMGRLTMQAGAIQDLARFPRSLADVVALVERLHPTRISFTKQATESAASHGVDVPRAWECLWSMATVLYDLHFVENRSLREIAGVFRNTTGFELAPFESEGTRQNRTLASRRMDVFDGEPIDISAHVKYGARGRRLLRAYYHAHREKRLIVVGHCGDHLDTVRTN